VYINNKKMIKKSNLVSICPHFLLSGVSICPVSNCPVSICPVSICPVSICPPTSRTPTCDGPRDRQTDTGPYHIRASIMLLCKNAVVRGGKASFKIVVNVTIRLHAYNLIFNFNGNWIVYRFRNNASYLSKLADFNLCLPHLDLGPNPPINFMKIFVVKKTRAVLFASSIAMVWQAWGPQITLITFVVEPSKLHSEYANRGLGFQKCNCFWPPTHGSLDSAHAQWPRTHSQW